MVVCYGSPGKSVLEVNRILAELKMSLFYSLTRIGLSIIKIRHIVWEQNFKLKLFLNLMCEGIFPLVVLVGC